MDEREHHVCRDTTVADVIQHTDMCEADQPGTIDQRFSNCLSQGRAPSACDGECRQVSSCAPCCCPLCAGAGRNHLRQMEQSVTLLHSTRFDTQQRSLDASGEDSSAVNCTVHKSPRIAINSRASPACVSNRGEAPLCSTLAHPHAHHHRLADAQQLLLLQ
jgi:hypothetical protein